MPKKSTQDKREAAAILRKSRRHFIIGEDKTGLFLMCNMEQADFVGILSELMLQDDDLRAYIETTVQTLAVYEKQQGDLIKPTTEA